MEPENTPPQADQYTDPEMQKGISQDSTVDYADGLGL